MSDKPIVGVVAPDPTPKTERDHREDRRNRVLISHVGLPSEDDDGSAAEIARLRADNERLARERDEARVQRDDFDAAVSIERAIHAREEALLAAEVAKLQGDRCDVCDEHGLIYVDKWDHGQGCVEEVPEQCPACGGTRSGYASEVTRERDAARAERDALAERCERMRAVVEAASIERDLNRWMKKWGLPLTRTERAVDAYRSGNPTGGEGER